MLKESDFIKAARSACLIWDLEPLQIDVISHSENIVCQVKVDSQRQVVMRLHRPGYNKLTELDSEIAWVRSLAESGLPVPTAVQTPSGDYYRSIDIGGPDSIERRIVGVIEWVKGQPLGTPLTNNSNNVVAHYKKIGALAAAIRRHSNSWERPIGFTRRRWDLNGLLGEDPLWGRFWDVTSLTKSQRSLFSEARAVLQNKLGELSTGPERFGLIHSDLHLGNIMNNAGALTIIDFDDAGYGWFAHEIAVALHPGVGESWFDEAREAFLEGYCSVYEIEPDEIASVDVFLTIRSLMIVGWLSDRPELPIYEHFPLVIRNAEQAAEKFLVS